MKEEIVIVGLNHRTAPVEVRERLAFAGSELDDANDRVRGLDTIEEATVICTCNRVEIVGCSKDGDRALQEIVHFLREQPGAGLPDVERHLYTYRGRDAVRHVFRVASSLDSMVVGEPQILGQLKDAYARAASAGATGTVLHRCFHKAFSVAKRVRTETGVATGSVSVSSAAVELARQIFDRIEDKTVMLIGAGEMGELTARHLLAQGVSGMMVTNRTFDRAVELAREFHATPVPFESFGRYLPMSDIVIGCVATTDYVLTEAQVDEALRGRKGRAIFCIDLGVPRNFDPRINEIGNVYLYDVDDLGGIAEENRTERAEEAEKAEVIVAEEVEAFWRWLGQLDVVPTIVALREKMESIRRGELQKALGSLKELTPEQQKVLDSMTSAIVNKILHTPLTCLKQENHRGEAFYVDATRRLFGLDRSEDS